MLLPLPLPELVEVHKLAKGLAQAHHLLDGDEVIAQDGVTYSEIGLSVTSRGALEEFKRSGP
jgi:hypothetical protein